MNENNNMIENILERIQKFLFGAVIIQFGISVLIFIVVGIAGFIVVNLMVFQYCESGSDNVLPLALAIIVDTFILFLVLPLFKINPCYVIIVISILAACVCTFPYSLLMVGSFLLLYIIHKVGERKEAKKAITNNTRCADCFSESKPVKPVPVKPVADCFRESEPVKPAPIKKVKKPDKNYLTMKDFGGGEPIRVHRKDFEEE